MKRKEALTMERLNAADPALAVTEEELARSREKSLAVMDTDANHVAVGGSIADFHQQPSKRRRRLMAGVGLVAAAVAAVVAGVAVTSSMSAPLTEQAAPAVTTPGTDDTDSPSTFSNSMFSAVIATGSTGHKAAVSQTEQSFTMDAAMSGTLGLNSAGCFVSVATDGSESSLIFPAGTRVTKAGVVLPDGTSFDNGDELPFGGGLSGIADLGECSSSSEAFLVQSWDPLP